METPSNTFYSNNKIPLKIKALVTSWCFAELHKRDNVKIPKIWKKREVQNSLWLSSIAFLGLLQYNSSKCIKISHRNIANWKQNLLFSPNDLENVFVSQNSH